MHITRLHIDRFGILSEQDVAGLSAGCNIFCGANEAGKSTTLQFFKAMLFGYTRGKTQLDPLHAKSTKKALAGGSLFLHSHTLGDITLLRRPKTKAHELELYLANGTALDASSFFAVLGHLTPDVFDNVFAFNLKALMDIGSLTGEAVRHALHAAVFGLGNISPAMLIKQLGQKADALVKQDRVGVTAPVNTLLRELEHTRQQLLALEPATQQYAKTNQQLQESIKEIQTLTLHKQTLASTSHKLHQRLGLWPHYEEWMLLQGACSTSTVPSACTFAPDALQRLEIALAQQEERQLNFVLLDEQSTQMHAELASLKEASQWYPLLPMVQSIREQTESKKQDGARLRSILTTLTELIATRQQGLERLGWTLEQLTAASPSLSMQEAVSSYEEQLLALRHHQTLAQKEEERLQRDVASLEAQLVHEHAMQLPVEPLPPQRFSLEQMGHAIFQAEQALNTLPLRMQDVTTAQRTLQQKLAEIHPSWQSRSPELASKHRAELEKTAQLLLQKTQAVERVKEVYDEHCLQVNNAQTACTTSAEYLASFQELPALHALEEAQVLLRNLAHMDIQRKAEQERFDEANAAINDLVAPLQVPPHKAIVVLRPCCLALTLLSCMAAAGATACWFIYQLPPLLWGGLGALGSSVIWGIAYAILRSMSAKKPPSAEETAFMLMLRSNRQKAQRTLESLATQRSLDIQALARLDVIALPDDLEYLDIAHALRRIEALQERLQEQYHAEAEHNQDRQWLEKQQQLQEHAAQNYANALQYEEQARHQWELALHNAGLDSQIQPETLAATIERITLAQVAEANLQSTRSAQEQVQQLLTACLKQAAAEPYFAMILTPWAQEHIQTPEKELDLPAATAAIRALAQQLTAAYQIHEEEQLRKTAATVRAEKQKELMALQKAWTQAHESTEACTAKLNAVSQQWEEWLGNAGLAQHLSPATAKDALHLIASLKEKEKHITALKEEAHILQQGLWHYLAEITQAGVQANITFSPACTKAIQDYLALNATTEPLSSGTAEPSLNTAENLSSQARSRLCLDKEAYLPPSYFACPDVDGLSCIITVFQECTHILDALTRISNDASKAFAKYQAMQEQYASLQKDRHVAQSNLTAAEQRIHALLHEYAMPSPEQFRQHFAQWQDQENLARKKRELLATFYPLAQEEHTTAQAIVEEMQQLRLAELQDSYRQANEELHACEQQLTALTEQKGTLEEHLRRLRTEEGAAALRQREIMLQEELQTALHQWRVLALAKNMLLASKAVMERSGHQGVMGIASELFARMTQNEYTGIVTGEEENNFFAIHKNGTLKDADTALSQGTKEQLYLALRLAYISNHASNAEPVPLFMDDILVNADPQRTAAIARELAYFSAHNQILYFTCHPATAELLYTTTRDMAIAETCPPPKQFHIRKGHILDA